MKKLTAIILSAIMLMSFNVYAEDNSYEKAISKVKETLDIGEYDVFNCSEHYYNGITHLNLDWHNENEMNNIEVSCDKEGNIYSYYAYTGKINKSQVYTENDCKKTADDFLKKILDNNFNSIEYMDYYMNSDSYFYIYNILSNGIPFSSDKITLNVNKYTNSVMNAEIPYDLFNIETNNFASAMSEEKAEEILKNKFDLVYITSYDHEAEKYNTILAYAPEYYYMDAYTGEEFENYYFYDYSANDTASYAKESAGGIDLTETEKNEIKDLQNIIKTENAVKKLNSFFGLNLNASDINYSYYKNEIGNKKYYSLNISNNDVYATFDQEGRLTYYSLYSYSELKNTADTENLINKAEKLIKDNYPTLDFVLTKNDPGNLSFTVLRNGIRSIDENIDIQFNGNEDITYANFSINNFAEYTDVNADISKDEAFNKGMEEYPLVKSYYVNDKNVVTDLYSLNAPYAINAHTGDIISSDNGKPISRKNKKVDSYSDINDQWYADIVTKLLYMGYRFEGDIFDGDKALTLNDFEFFYNGADEILRYDTNYDSEKYSKDPDAPLTRYEFAEIFTDIMGYSKITDLDIYKAPYEDTDKGSVAIMKGLGLLDNDSTFNGDNIITRAETANIVYKYVTSM